jgi:hypothetical protein
MLASSLQARPLPKPGGIETVAYTSVDIAVLLFAESKLPSLITCMILYKRVNQRKGYLWEL